MLSKISLIATTLALTLAPASEPTAHGGDGGGLLGGGLLLGIGLGGDGEGGGVEVALGDCFGVDIEKHADCGILVGVDAMLECNPLSVEAACVAELGANCGLAAFAACTAALTAHCEAELLAGGALFCEGHFIGADACLGGIDVDIDLDADECVDVDLGGDVDLDDFDVDLGLCLDLDLGLGVDCYIAQDAGCHAKCDPIAAEAYCGARISDDDEIHAYAACQAEVVAHCHEQCDDDGAVFCDGDIYAGADLCLGVGLGIGIGL